MTRVDVKIPASQNSGHNQNLGCFFCWFCFSGVQDTISNLLVKKMDAEAKEDYSIKTYWVCSSLVKPFIEELL